MGIEVDLRGLVAAAGPAVLSDPDQVRAALDDVLDEDAATSGELNLLVDAVRLGALQHLGTLLASGADPDRAVAEAAVRLAADRGTADVDSSAWAVSVLGAATGVVGDDMVRPRPGAAAQARPAPSPAPVAAPKAATTAPRPPSVVPVPATIPPPSADPSPAPVAAPSVPDRRGGRRGRLRVPAVVAAVVLPLAAAIGTVVALDRVGAGGDGGGTGAATDTSVVMDPAAATGARLTVDPAATAGVRSSRTYVLDGDVLTSTVRLTNTTHRPVDQPWIEVVPKRLARDVDQVDYRPAYDRVVRRDPIVHWRLRLPPGASTRISWSVPRPAAEGDDATVLRTVIGWHADEVVATRETVRTWVRRNVGAGAADRLDVPVPDTSSATGPGTGGTGGTSVAVDDPTSSALPVPPVPPLPTVPPSTPSARPSSRPSSPAPPNSPTTFSLAARSSDEQRSVSWPVSVSDADGIRSVTVSGLPAGLGYSGSSRTISGYLSHAAASLPHPAKQIFATTRTVTVTVVDRRGQRRSSSFGLTIRDTHWVMPSYIGKTGESPDIGPRFTPRFDACYSETGEKSVIVQQEIAPGTVVAYGQSAFFLYRERDPAKPPC